MRIGWTAALAALILMATAGGASAQSWTKESSPLVIHDVVAPEGEQIARKDEPLLVQPMTSLRSVRISAPAPTLLSLSSTKEYPAGTALYGLQAPDGWIYCAAAAGNWLIEAQTICYQDMDQDGAFDRVRNSGVPFGGVPLLAYAFGEHKLLDRPVPYTAIPQAEGPAISYVVRWNPVREKLVWGKPTPPVHSIGWGASLKTGDQLFALGSGSNIPILPNDRRPGAFAPMHVLGAVIVPLGITEDGSLRYRVERAIPAQVLRIRMTMTTYTYYYVY